MGLFSWLWEVVSGFFGKEESVEQTYNSKYQEEQIDKRGYQEVHVPKEQIPKYVREFRRLETKNFKLLSTSSQKLFKKLYQDLRIDKHKKDLIAYVEQVEIIVKEKDINVQFADFKVLYTQVWTPLRSNLLSALRNETEITKI